jgi:hypothetical protein
MIKINKISIATLAAAGLVFCSTSAFADGAHFVDQNPIVVANNEVGIAATGTLMNYQEHITEVPSDIESGWMPGFAVKYSLMGDYFGSMPSNMYFAIHYQFSSGSIAYKGSVGGTPYDGTDDATTNRATARLGKGFSLSDDMMITPYVAGGYQDWNRDLQGPYGYVEDYHSDLIGAGVMFQYAINPRLVIGANLEGLAMIGGGMTPHIYNGILGSASFDTSGQEKIGADIDYRVFSQWHFYGGLRYTHFNYTGGPLKYGAFEPSSSTNLFSMDAGVAYHF